MAKKGHKAAKAALRRPTKPPIEFAHILVWYDEIRNRTLRGFRFEPMQITDLIAYRDLFDIDLDPFDAELLFMVDDIWQRSQPEPDGGKEPDPRRMAP